MTVPSLPLSRDRFCCAFSAENMPQKVCSRDCIASKRRMMRYSPAGTELPPSWQTVSSAAFLPMATGSRSAKRKPEAIQPPVAVLSSALAMGAA